MPPKGRASEASKKHPSRKSTRKVQKTARSEQAELEFDEDKPELPPAEQDIFSTLADDDDDFYVNDEEETRFMRREEEEESEEEEGIEGEDHDQDEDDEDEEPVVPVVPQKRKKGKDPKNPISKIFLTLYLYRILSK